MTGELKLVGFACADSGLIKHILEAFLGSVKEGILAQFSLSIQFKKKTLSTSFLNVFFKESLQLLRRLKKTLTTSF